MGTADPNIGVGSKVAGACLCVAAELFTNFEFWRRQNRVS